MKLWIVILTLAAGSLMAQDKFEKRWQQIERLEKGQKYAAALEKTISVYRDAMEWDNGDQATKALIRSVLLQRALHGYETALRILLKKKWPVSEKQRILLRLFYADSLRDYYRRYGWEIDRRVKTVSGESMDISKWTAREIFDKINEQYALIYRLRDILGSMSVESCKQYVQRGEYPGRIRATMRDFVAYQWIQVLSDTKTWRLWQLKEVHGLNLSDLSAPSNSRKLGNLAFYLDERIHPLKKIVYICDDLYMWHQKNGRHEAALESQLERFRRLKQHFTDPVRASVMAIALKAQLKQFLQYSWWAYGQYEYALLVKRQGDLAAAYLAAMEGYKRYPKSIGGNSCLHLAKNIETPDVAIRAMSVDRVGASVQISHKNITHLYFRAYRIDFFSWVRQKKRYLGGVDQNEVRDLVMRQPEYSWQVTLKAYGDYQKHVTYAKTAVDKNGFYIIAASVKPDFSLKPGNRISAAYMLFSSMVIVVNPRQRGWEVLVLDGMSGHKISHAKVGLYQHRYDVPHAKLMERYTDEEGFAYIPYPESGSYYFIASKKDSFTFMPRYLYPPYRSERNAQGCFVYTDRSVYRPLQKVYFKVIAYQGNAKNGNYSCVPRCPVSTKLIDSNRHVVAVVSGITNEYGSASGEIVIPEGILLGQYSLVSQVNSLQGRACLRIEEYKPPGYRVMLEKPETPLKLGQKVQISGKAMYSFGLPVTSGKVFYRVLRRPALSAEKSHYPLSIPSFEVAAGYSELKDDGSFTIFFNASADRINTYCNFHIEVEITDEAGETCTGVGDYPIGSVSLKAEFQIEDGFFTPDEPVRISIFRGNLSNVPMPGKGEYRLVQLELPKKVMSSVSERTTNMAGDEICPRWEESPGLKGLFLCKDAREIKRGKLNHGKNGRARLNIGKLPKGAYRIYYSTSDYWGAKCQARKEFVVATDSLSLPIPFFLILKNDNLSVGDNALLFAGSGFENQPYFFEVYQGRELLKRELRFGATMITLPILAKHRGGFSVRIMAVRDYRLYLRRMNIYIPWENKRLDMTLKNFHDILQPGQKETWTVCVRDPSLETANVEILAYMYDSRLDEIVAHTPPRWNDILPNKCGLPNTQGNLYINSFSAVYCRDWFKVAPYIACSPDRLKVLSGYPIGGPGRRTFESEQNKRENGNDDETDDDDAQKVEGQKLSLRSDFSQTAFFIPHLRTDKNGEAKIEFKVPESITSWNVCLYAITKDIRFMSLKKTLSTRKDLTVRVCPTRFLREGDIALVKVALSNATSKPLSGSVTLAILDANGEDKSPLFALAELKQTWKAKGKSSAFACFRINAPKKIGVYKFKAVAESGDLIDGELRPFVVLPGRFHLIQSKFATVRGGQKKTLQANVPGRSDPTLISDSLVITTDARLVNTAARTIPYLLKYPYQSVEQASIRFFAAGIAEIFCRQYPKTEMEFPKHGDANRTMAIEETPWLLGESEAVLNALDLEIAKKQRENALKRLLNAQLSRGAFPWWPGGPPSPQMTLRILYTFARARELGISTPKAPEKKAWMYMGEYFREHCEKRMCDGSCPFVTFLNYVLSCCPDSLRYREAFSEKQREQIAEYSLSHWKEQSPCVKAYLALTLNRMGRKQEARLILESILDSAITNEEQGTFWAPEERGWLWYNDNIESHALILRALVEIAPKDENHADGLILWLLLNKKLNHWKSTRATAEVLYSLLCASRFKQTSPIRETALISAGEREYFIDFEREGNRRQISLNSELADTGMAKVVVENTGKGKVLASLDWHYSTEKLPEKASEGFLSIERNYYRRSRLNDGFELCPIEKGVSVEVGDQVEVHITISAAHPMEYIHLRDPRGAGFEPETQLSGHHWQFGICWYQEVRDSGCNFFFENLPQGKYTFKYRLRATAVGKFRIVPATVQSMYAPEFTGFSRGKVIKIVDSARE